MARDKIYEQDERYGDGLRIHQYSDGSMSVEFGDLTRYSDPEYYIVIDDVQALKDFFANLDKPDICSECGKEKD